MNQSESTPPIKPSTGKDRRSLRERLEKRAWRHWKTLLQHMMGQPLPRTHVFVAGMQRSGTNMLMETLEWSRYTDVFHEADPRAFDNYEMRPREVIHALARNSPAPYFIIKSLCELDQIKSLLDEFEPSKALWIVRSYEDTVNSAIRSFGNFSDQLHRLARDKRAAGWRGRGMSDETQEILHRCDHPDINEPSAAALMWYYRNILFFEQELERDPRVKLMFYEDLVSAPQPALRGVFDFLAMPDWSPCVSRYIHAASIRKSPQANIAPEARRVCNDLANRFSALRPA